MTDNYNDVHGEHPGNLNLTTCTGCGFALAVGGVGTHCQNCGKPWAEAEAAALFPVQQPGVTAATNGVPFSKPPRIAPDEVLLKRALVEEVLEALAWVADLGTFDIAVNYGTMPDGHRLHEAIDAALAAASGDDGGTP